MTPDELHQASAELDLLRNRIELVFWTITMTLAVITLMAMTVLLLVSMIAGTSVASQYIALGAGIAGASAGKTIPSLLRHFVHSEPSA